MRVALALLTVSCASPPPAPELVDQGGWDAPPPVNAVPSVTAPRALPPAERPAFPAEHLQGLTLASDRVASEHLGGDLERTVWVNAAAGDYRRLLPTTSFPPGATVVAKHHPPDVDRVVSLYVMQKTESGWRFEVLDPALRRAVLEAPPSCARCHAEAPYDGIFGPPAR